MNKLLEKLLDEAYEFNYYGDDLSCRHCRACVWSEDERFPKLYALWCCDAALNFPHDKDCLIKIAEQEYEKQQKRLSTRRRRIIRALSFR